MTDDLLQPWGAAYPSASHRPTDTLAQASRSYDYRLHANVDERRHAPKEEKRKLGSEPRPINHGREAGGSGGKKRRLESDAITAKERSGSVIRASASGPGLGSMMVAEMRQRKREALGMNRERRLGGELGSVGKAASSQASSGSQAVSNDVSQARSKVTQEWGCPRCTLLVPCSGPVMVIGCS